MEISLRYLALGISCYQVQIFVIKVMSQKGENMLKNHYLSLVGCRLESFWLQQRHYGQPSSSTTYFRSRFEKLKYYPFSPLNIYQIVKKLPINVIENINFKPIWGHFFAFFSNDFRNKKNPYRDHQINFLLHNINDGDKMNA